MRSSIFINSMTATTSPALTASPSGNVDLGNHAHHRRAQFAAGLRSSADVGKIGDRPDRMRPDGMNVEFIAVCRSRTFSCRPLEDCEVSFAGNPLEAESRTSARRRRPAWRRRALRCRIGSRQLAPAASRCRIGMGERPSSPCPICQPVIARAATGRPRLLAFGHQPIARRQRECLGVAVARRRQPFVETVVDQPGMEVSVAGLRQGDQSPKKILVCGDAEDRRLSERVVELSERRFARPAAARSAWPASSRSTG